MFMHPQAMSIEEIQDELWANGCNATYHQIYYILNCSDIAVNIVKHNTTPYTYSILNL